MNIFVYILGRIPPTICVSSAKWSPILQTGWLWCHSMQMVCTEYSVCVECTVCLLWKKLHRIELHKYCKKDQLNSGRKSLFIERHSVHYQIRPGILRFSVHILIGLLVPVYLCTKIPLWSGSSGKSRELREHTPKKTCLNLVIAQIRGTPLPYEIWAPKEHFSPGCSKNFNTVFVQWKSNELQIIWASTEHPPPLWAMPKFKQVFFKCVLP